MPSKNEPKVTYPEWVWESYDKRPAAYAEATIAEWATIVRDRKRAG